MRTDGTQTAVLTVALCAFTSFVNAQSVPLVLLPFREATVAATVDSELTDYGYRIGEPFTNGAVIARLDDARYRTNFLRAREQLDFTAEIAKEQNELRSKDFTSEMELRKARHDVKIAEADYAEAELNLKRCCLYAPFNGKIAELLTQRYEMVKPGQPLFRIIEDERLLAVANLPLGAVRVGATVTVKPEGAAAVQGTVYEVAPQADNRTGTVRVRIQIDNAGGKLTAGMTGHLEMPDEPVTEAVPESPNQTAADQAETPSFEFTPAGIPYDNAQVAFDGESRFVLTITNDWRAFLASSNFPAHWRDREIVVRPNEDGGMEAWALPSLSIAGIHFDSGVLSFVLHRYPRPVSLQSVKRVGQLTAGLYDEEGRRIAHIPSSQVTLPSFGSEVTNVVQFPPAEYLSACQGRNGCRLVMRVEDDVRTFDVKLGDSGDGGK